MEALFTVTGNAASASQSACEAADPVSPHSWVRPVSGVASLYDVPIRKHSFTVSEIAALHNSLLPGLTQTSFLSIVVHSICFFS